MSQEELSDRKPDPWPLGIAGHAQLKFIMTECSKTQIRLTRHKYNKHAQEMALFYKDVQSTFSILMKSTRKLYNYSLTIDPRGSKGTAHEYKINTTDSYSLSLPSVMWSKYTYWPVVDFTKGFKTWHKCSTEIRFMLIPIIHCSIYSTRVYNGKVLT